jgi:hypothetical protein
VIPLVLNGKAAGSVAAVEDELADFSTICDAGVIRVKTKRASTYAK